MGSDFGGALLVEFVILGDRAEDFLDDVFVQVVSHHSIPFLMPVLLGGLPLLGLIQFQYEVVQLKLPANLGLLHLPFVDLDFEAWLQFGLLVSQPFLFASWI